MARKPQVAVEPRPDGRWAVQTDGTSRADSLHDNKASAVSRARKLAENKKTELVIKGSRAGAESASVSERDFADFYARFVARCAVAGFRPTPPMVAAALVAQHEPLNAGRRFP